MPLTRVESNIRINFVGDRLQDTEVKLENKVKLETEMKPDTEVKLENKVPPETAGVDVVVPLHRYLCFEPTFSFRIIV